MASVISIQNEHAIQQQSKRKRIAATENQAPKAKKTRRNFSKTNTYRKLDGSLPANPVNDRRIANAVTLKSTFCLQ